MHCKSLQFLGERGERFHETLKKFENSTSNLLKSGFYLLVCFVRCSKMLGQFIQIVTELLEIFVCHFCLASKEIFHMSEWLKQNNNIEGGRINRKPEECAAALLASEARESSPKPSK